MEIEYDDKIIKIEKEVYEDCVFESEIVIEKNSIDKMLYEENINDINNIECADLPKPIFNKLDKLDYYSNEVIKNKSNRENVYICSFCHNCFSSQKSLIFHINQSEHHISNNVSRKSCLDSIKFKPIKKITLKKKSFECEICLKHFSDYSNCRRHIRNHTSINKLKILEEFKCLICMKTFSSKYSLQVHNRIHTGETPYKCDICQLTFNRNDAMLLHRKNHGEEYSTIIHCNKCEKSFHTNSSFSRHQRLHKNEKRFSCTYCQKSYTRKDSLITHIRSKHTSEKPYQCNICKKSFFEKCVLERHKKSHQKKEIK